MRLCVLALIAFATFTAFAGTDAPPLPPGYKPAVRAPRQLTVAVDQSMSRSVVAPLASNGLIQGITTTTRYGWTNPTLIFRTNFTGRIECSRTIVPWETLAVWRVTNVTAIPLCAIGIDRVPCPQLFYRARHD